MSPGLGWARLRSFASGFEADEARAVLEEEGILVLLRGMHVGIFGPGFQGAVPGGVEIMVPAPDLERAQTLLAAWPGEIDNFDADAE